MIERPEAATIAGQMAETLVGKGIGSASALGSIPVLAPWT